MAKKKGYRSPEMQSYSLSRETFKSSSGTLNKIEGGGTDYNDTDF